MIIVLPKDCLGLHIACVCDALSFGHKYWLVPSLCDMRWDFKSCIRSHSLFPLDLVVMAVDSPPEAEGVVSVRPKHRGRVMSPGKGTY